MVEPNIKVGILSSKKIRFTLEGQFQSNGMFFSGEKSIIYEEGTIVFENKAVETLLFEPVTCSSTFILEDVIIGIGFHWERKERQQFQGSLYVIVDQEQLVAINIVSAETYLMSVISSEMSATASLELLKAHAVLSRSWLLYPLFSKKRILKHKSDAYRSQNRLIRWYERDAHLFFDVCADDHCQRYQGITRTTTPAVEDAVIQTAGMVLMDHDDICDARYYKSCGGATEVFESCWENEPHRYLSSVYDKAKLDGNEPDLREEKQAEKWIRSSPDAFCNTKNKALIAQIMNDYDAETVDFYRWKVRYSQHEISHIIHKKSGIDFGNIMDLIPIKRGYSGRIIELKIIGSKKELIVGKELEIRKWLSESHLYSAAFVVDKFGVKQGIPDCFILTGAGWGHGVGLCQIGAAVMSENEYAFDQILAHYFNYATIRKIY